MTDSENIANYLFNRKVIAYLIILEGRYYPS